MSMRRRLFLVAGFAVAALLIWLVLHGGTSRYQGRTLDNWFRRYCASGTWMREYDDVKRAEAADAIKHFGTNALPYLLERSFDFAAVSSAQSNRYEVLNSIRPNGIAPFVTSWVMINEAPEAIEEIKPPAGLLIPCIRGKIGSTNVMDRRQSYYVLGTAGENAEQAVPYLVAGLKDPDFWARLVAVAALGRLGPKASAAAPDLSELFVRERGTGSTNFLPRLIAATFGNIGSDAAPALPLLRQLFENETNWNNRCVYATALCQIDPGQTAALLFLIDGVTVHQPASDRSQAAQRLAQLGTNARAAEPVLLQTLTNATDTTLWYFTAQAITNAGIPTEVFLPIFKQKLASGDPTMRATVAEMVLDIDPGDLDAQSVLKKLLNDNVYWSVDAAQRLGRLGAAAKPAIPALRAAQKSKLPQLREAASWALKKIEATADSKK